jgi:phosphatidate cytidylyltransferase
MLRTRLWMGALLLGLAVAVLIVDQWLEPVFPFLYLLCVGLALLAAHELVQLLRASAWSAASPALGLCLGGVAAVVSANWAWHVLPDSVRGDSPWAWVTGVFAATLVAVFLVEMATFREAGRSTPRMALASWIIAYVGILTSFFVQLRWLPDLAPESAARRGSLALALAIFVPKFGDSGAYFTGRLLGRHRMTPVLSPKKTWEGAAGAAVASVLTAVGIASLGPVLRGGLWSAALLGVAVGVVGLLGDLAESLIKRDCQQKDASQIMPGFGGVLDVVDSVIFSAPVTYWFLQWA